MNRATSDGTHPRLASCKNPEGVAFFKRHQNTVRHTKVGLSFDVEDRSRFVADITEEWILLKQKGRFRQDTEFWRLQLPGVDIGTKRAEAFLVFRLTTAEHFAAFETFLAETASGIEWLRPRSL